MSILRFDLGIAETRKWLDENGFNGKFMNWKSNELLGVDKSDLLIEVPGLEGTRLWSLLGTSKSRPALAPTLVPVAPPPPPMTVIEQSNRDCLVKTTNTIGDPCLSTFGKSIRHYVHLLQSRNQIGDLQFHRNPEEPFSFPTSLAMPLIGEYYDEVNSVVPDHVDLIYAEDLCLSMMESYQCEQDRMTVASDIFQAYFRHAISRIQFNSTSGSSITTDGTITLLLQTLNEKAMIFNYEAKNELGQGGSSAVEKCLWYHVQWLCDQQSKLLERCCCPAILASLVGPFLSFSVGMQHAGRYITDPVTPFLHLMVLPYQQEAMMKVAQALRATKNAIAKLISEYQRWDHLSTMEASHAKEQLQFPYPRSFVVNGVEEIEFRYLHAMNPEEDHRNCHHLLYLVEITKSSSSPSSLLNIPQQQLVVKFTKNYGQEVHAGLASIGLAPGLYSVVRLPGGWQMVVMEYVNWPRLHNLSFADTVARTILANVKKALEYLSSTSFVHGDFRPNNILVNAHGEIRIVDFDDSGRTTGSELARYPPFLNVTTITWHSDVRRGGLMKESHDHYFYLQLFPHLDH